MTTQTTTHPKIENMVSSRGNRIPNQFLIQTDDGIYFQSYQTIIAFNPIDRYEPTQLDRDKWAYSVTTGKYRNMFLGENKAATERKIASGEYVLVDLN